jgi:arylsulfatase A-like enzyme
MQRFDDKRSGGLNRRTFIKRGLAAGGLAGAGAAIWAATDTGSPARKPRRATSAAPNILVIVVDQLRFPQWFSPAPGAPGLPPNLARLRQGAVSFAHHYTASNDCTPARAALLTGLYTHQTGCMITGASTLNPGFPTWGTILREQGYDTYWYGKWHLTHGDRFWTAATGAPVLDSYGFSGGTYPSPNGSPGQGWRVDPHITAQFDEWFAHHGSRGPWCTTVSLVNPHDISWWYRWSDRLRAEATAPSTVSRLPPNFETPELLAKRHKPRLQRSLQETSASAFGAVPFTGPDVLGVWLAFLDLYVKLQLEVDRHIGRVLDTLESRPEVAANTVVVFTSDHGEYGASHGLRGKGAAAYDEGIRVPLLVKDPRGLLTSAPEVPRTQLTSSVDVAPLLLTIAAGSDAWRRDSHYAHIAGRLDIGRILADPQAPGRPYELHATDEIVTEFATELYDAPLHVVALRTERAKYAIYSDWHDHSIEPLRRGQDRELYDYRSHSGRLELDNSAGSHPLEESLDAQLERALREELRGALPARLGVARELGFNDYFSTARHVARVAAARRRQRERRFLGTAGGELPPNAQLRG